MVVGYWLLDNINATGGAGGDKTLSDFCFVVRYLFLFFADEPAK
jgi:hypothetical protein